MKLNKDELEIDEIAEMNDKGFETEPKYGKNRIAIEPRNVFGLDISNGYAFRFDDMFVIGSFLR